MADAVHKCMDDTYTLSIVWCGVMIVMNYDEGEEHDLTSVLWEAYSEWTLLDFVLKQILLIQEQNNWSISEPLVITNGVEQF